MEQKNVVLQEQNEKTVTIKIVFSFPKEMSHDEIEYIVNNGLGTLSIGGDLLENIKEYTISYDYMAPLSFDDLFFED